MLGRRHDRSVTEATDEVPDRVPGPGGSGENAEHRDRTAAQCDRAADAVDEQADERDTVADARDDTCDARGDTKPADRDAVRVTGVGYGRRCRRDPKGPRARMWEVRMDEPLIGSWAFADSWINVDQTADPTFFVGVLDGTRAGLLERARRDPGAFFDPLRLRAGHRVLDVGCGTGDLLRLLAPLVAPADAIGIDLSATMIAEARRRHAGHEPNVSFEVGDVFALRYDTGAFDRVLASQVLLHLPHVEVALAEVARVLAPDGELSVTEIDWGSISIECSDRMLSRRFTALACDGLRNGMIVRDLPAMLRRVGLTEIEVQPELTVSWEPDAFHTWFIEPSLRHFIHSGTFTIAEGTMFLDDLRQRAASGTYFSARTTYSITAHRHRS